MIVYVTHFKGHLEIYALPSCCQHQQQDLISPLQNVFEKIKRYQYKSCSQLFGTSIAFLQLIISLFFKIHSEASIGVLVKRLFEFLDQPSISISKNSFSENFGKLSSENIHFGVLYSSTFTGLLGVGKTTYLERFISILEVQKKVFLRNFRWVLRCAHAFRWLI